jgi:hypothetical protein
MINSFKSFIHIRKSGMDLDKKYHRVRFFAVFYPADGSGACTPPPPNIDFAPPPRPENFFAIPEEKPWIKH